MEKMQKIYFFTEVWQKYRQKLENKTINLDFFLEKHKKIILCLKKINTSAASTLSFVLDKYINKVLKNEKS